MPPSSFPQIQEPSFVWWDPMFYPLLSGHPSVSKTARSFQRGSDRGLSGCRNEGSPSGGGEDLRRGELAGGDGRLGAGSTTHLRMCHFTFSGLGNSALLAAGERPETVNIKFFFVGSKPVPPEWPDKGSHHFLRDKIHLS